jgi:hypothetical protein
MLIVFPFSRHDLHLAVPLMAWIRNLGPYPRHDLLLAYSEELTREEREAVAVNARECGWRTPATAFDARIPVQQWPAAPNAIFAQAATLIWNTPELRKAWMFLEPDATPMRAGWADAIADAYNENLSLPFMGVIDNTYSAYPDGTLVKTGEHLCGVAVYPPNLATYTQRHLNCTVAFDHAMAPDIRPKARNSPLFQDNWSTGNYRMDGERIVCDPITLRVALTGRSITRTVRPESVMLHGCKDGSLIKLLDSSSDSNRQKPARDVEARKPSRVPRSMKSQNPSKKYRTKIANGKATH